MLLNKGVILFFVTIVCLILFNNISYATNSIIGTKDRIKEIRIIEEINIYKLIRNREKELVNYTRESTKVLTSRNGFTRIDKADNEAKKSTNPKDVKITKNMDLTKRTGLSKEDFKKVIKNLKQDRSGFFYNNADTIYDLCEKYEINEIFFCGLIVAESGWNIANNHRSTHNYISMMYKGKLIRYSSTEEGLEVAAKKLNQNYLTPGGKFYSGKTIAGVQKRFCPVSSTWDDLVYGAMKSIVVAANKTTNI